MRVLIIGAGPTGLTLALGLRQRGIAARLVDQAPAPATTSRALGVQARTLEVMERLGLAEALLARAQRIAGLALHPGPGAPLLLDLAPVHPRFPAVVLLPQTETEALLAAAGAAPERGLGFAGLDGGRALLRHPDGREEAAEADWIIGCDGAHSAVRHALGARFEGGQYPFQAVLADGCCTGLDRARIHLFPRRERLLGFFPLPGGDAAAWRAIALLPPDAPPPPEAPSAAPFALEGLAPLRDIGWYSSFRISHRQVPQVRHGRVLLCGDAAHIHSPAGGQGMNLGIQDAWSLAAALPRGEAAVDAWAAERHAVAARVLRATDAGTRMMTARNPMLGLLRQAAFGTVAALPPLRRRITRAVAGLDYPPVPA